MPFMKTIIANWKMYVGARECVELARATLSALGDREGSSEVVLCPPFVALADVGRIIAGSRVALGAQDVFWETQGAFTGEISVSMLKDSQVSRALVGHSERRALGETDAMVNKKIRALLAGGIIPVFCVGETALERDSGKAEETVIRQLQEGLNGVSLQKEHRLFVAYEPVWAIGTGRRAEASDVVEIHKTIRKTVSDLLSSPVSVLYGGSVDEKSASAFLREPEIDGVLVGSASVRADAFAGILDAAFHSSL